ncbi:MAG TPA: hypothetical protein VHY75_14555 [Steroidobacteraceae bacterium]|nr:hypothetical protein [Steroidobacteraceae bacterium]
MIPSRWLKIRRWRIFGAPIYVHSYVLLGLCLFAVVALRHPVAAAAATLSYLAIIFVHELGHAAVAHRLGYEVMALRVGLFHGRCEYSHPDNEWDAVLVSWGGAAAQLMAATAVFSLAAIPRSADVPYFGVVVIFLGYLNIVIAAMNIAPVAGLDGALAWRIFPAMLRQIRGRAIVRGSIRRASQRRRSN